MDCETPDQQTTIREKRIKTRIALNALPDFSANKFGIEFRQSFVTLKANETFFLAPEHLVESCRRLLTLELDVTVARLVHDNVTVRIVCNVVAPFALVSGGRDRSISCSAVSTMRARRSLMSGSSPERTSGNG